MSETTAAAQNT